MFETRKRRYYQGKTETGKARGKRPTTEFEWPHVSGLVEYLKKKLPVLTIPLPVKFHILEARENS